MPQAMVEENVAVASFDGYLLRVDVARPANSAEGAPGLLFLPGGGWVTANREPLKERYGIPMAERGYVCVTGEYRVMEQARWPAAIRDVKSILSWMRANSASLGLDPKRLAVGGKSAGGHLALLAGAANTGAEFEGNGGNGGSCHRVSAAIGVAPASDIREYWRRPDLEPYTADDPSDRALTAANPIEQVNSDYAPTLLLHGTDDERVPHQATLEMFRALEQAGVPVELALFAGQGHMFDQDPRFSQAIVAAMDLFLSRYVVALVADGVGVAGD